jgi:hypothetical protein
LKRAVAKISSARLQTISIEETVNYLDGALSTQDFRLRKFRDPGKRLWCIANLHPHHPASAKIVRITITANHLSRILRCGVFRLFFTFSAKAAQSFAVGSRSPLSRQLSSKRLIQGASSSPRALR